MSEDTIDYILDKISKLELQVHYLQQSAEKDTILVKRRKLHEDAVYPFQAHNGDAGWDLVAIEDVELPFGVPVKVKTGLSLQMPQGYYCSIRDRSGLGSKGIHVLGGVIDHQYTGEYVVILVNLNGTKQFIDYDVDYDGNDRRIISNHHLKDGAPYQIKAGDKIAQLVFSRVPDILWSECEFEETNRNEKGFGSSGSNVSDLSKQVF